MNLRILSSTTTSVPFTLTTVQVPNLALTHTKRITVRVASRLLIAEMEKGGDDGSESRRKRDSRCHPDNGAAAKEADDAAAKDYQPVAIRPTAATKKGRWMLEE
jgi:hypothetical protein